MVTMVQCVEDQVTKYDEVFWPMVGSLVMMETENHTNKSCKISWLNEKRTTLVGVFYWDFFCVDTLKSYKFNTFFYWKCQDQGNSIPPGGFWHSQSYRFIHFPRSNSNWRHPLMQSSSTHNPEEKLVLLIRHSQHNKICGTSFPPGGVYSLCLTSYNSNQIPYKEWPELIFIGGTI